MKNIMQTARPVNVLLTAVSVSVGYWFGAGAIFELSLVPAAVSASLICAGGNIFNDFFDREVDKINRPDRPYAAGLITSRSMIAAGSVCMMSGILFSLLTGGAGFLIAAAAVVLLMIYNRYAKKTVLAGNAIVSIITGLTFIYGASAAGNASGAVIPALFALIYHFGREILKDIEDMPGDRRLNIGTLPVRYGDDIALMLAILVFAILIISTFLPYVFLEYSIYYLIAVIVGVDFLVLTALTRYVLSRNSIHLKQLNRILKAGMIAGLAALALR
ncbi:geranylgeranylglycerol-phosphate geranylgeranyltransferase [candidate division KSB1 bacterium]